MLGDKSVNREVDFCQLNSREGRSVVGFADLDKHRQDFGRNLVRCLEATEPVIGYCRCLNVYIIIIAVTRIPIMSDLGLARISSPYNWTQ